MNTIFFHLKIMLRNLQRGGIYSAINVGGLAIGMAAAILILAWIYHEWSYDRFHAKEKQLYVVYQRGTFNGSLLCWDWTPNILATTLKNDYPDMVGVTSTTASIPLICANGDTKVKIWSAYTEPDFLTMFDFPLLHGDRETALNEPYSMVLTEKAAKRLFGNEDPLGKMIKVNNFFTVAVTGVMRDLPGNTLFQFEALTPVAFQKAMGWFFEQWNNSAVQTYVELHPKARLDLVNESIRGIVQAHTDNNESVDLFLYPLGKRHLYSKFENGVPVGGLIDTLQLFAMIAGLILLIACINFMNLSTARSEKRAKEVGVRKVMGGKRLSLIRLFMGESLLVAFIAGATALILVLMVLPVFSTLMGKQLAFDLTNGWFWLIGLGFVLFTSILAGSYPAFYLSSFLPIKVLKGVYKTKRALISPRKVLVVVQFTIACSLILATLVVHRQIRYAQDRETGYNKDQLIYSFLDGALINSYDMLQHDLLNSGAALSSTRSLSPMTERWATAYDVSWRGKDPDAGVMFDLFQMDAYWAKTAGVTIVEGRDIDIFTYATDSTAMLLNESAVKVMGLKNPIGEIIRTLDINWHVVGVVKDFIVHSPYETITPMLVGGPVSEFFNVLHIKLNGANRMATNLAKVEEVFRKYSPDGVFEYRFVDEEYARKFQEEQKMRTLSTCFAGLTIFISCLGLFALVSYMAENRRKEIGIRKVLGASVSDVIILLSKEFIILVLISVAVASPIAWWAMEKWLSNYAYRTNIPWWLFVVVGCISLGIALLTVGFQAFKAATENPVKAIKSE